MDDHIFEREQNVRCVVRTSLLIPAHYHDDGDDYDHVRSWTMMS